MNKVGKKELGSSRFMGKKMNAIGGKMGKKTTGMGKRNSNFSKGTAGGTMSRTTGNAMRASIAGPHASMLGRNQRC